MSLKAIKSLDLMDNSRHKNEGEINLTTQERLEAVKKTFGEKFIHSDIKWLIERAEKAEQYAIADDYDLDMIIDLQNKVERLEKALDRIGFYCAGTDFNNISDFVLRVKNGEDI